MDGHRACRGCGTTDPAAFSPSYDKSCRACRAIETRAYREGPYRDALLARKRAAGARATAERRARVATQPQPTKPCAECGQLIVRKNTAQAERTWSGVRYCSARCRKRVRDRLERVRRPQVVRARHRRNYQRHRAKKGAYQRAWRGDNPEKTRVYGQRWYYANPEKARASAARNRARRRGALGNHTFQEWLDKCALFGNLCVYCGETRPLTRDHNIPLCRGGTHNITNILPACKPCNSRKRTRTTEEFLALRRAA